MTSVFDIGRARALDDFGVRTAMFKRPLPHGDTHAGAERLARLLSGADDSMREAKTPRTKSVDRATQWGEKFSPYATLSPSHDYSGLGSDTAAA